MNDALAAAHNAYVWKPEFTNLPPLLLRKVKEHYLFALLNYYDASIKYQYLKDFRYAGLRPNKLPAMSGLMVLWHALASDFMITLGKLLDKDIKSHGIPALIYLIKKYSNQYSQFNIEDIDALLNLNSSHIKEALELRNSVFGHSDRRILKILSKNKMNDDDVERCLEDVFNCLVVLNAALFEGSIMNDIGAFYDIEFRDNVITMINNQHG